MKIGSKILSAIFCLLLLTSCGNTVTEAEITPSMETANEPVASEIQEYEPEENPTYIPTLKIKYYRESENDREIIDTIRDAFSDDVVLVWSEEEICDILISEVNLAESDEEKYIEVNGLAYFPLLLPEQAICIDIDTNPIDEGATIQIAYTSAASNYEVTYIVLEDESVFLHPEPARPSNDGHRNSNPNRPDLSGFWTKTEAGAFDDHIPLGFQVVDGCLGDVNGDGIDDALIVLESSGYKAAARISIRPMFILLGNHEGGYTLAKKVPSPLFSWYRQTSSVTVDSGYIDVVYYWVGSAYHHDTEVYRFTYDEVEQDWLLMGFSYRHAIDYMREPDYLLVSPLPDMEGMRITDLHPHLDKTMTDFESFDIVSELQVPLKNYRICVNTNMESGTYEGFLYHQYDDSPGDSLIHEWFYLDASLSGTSIPDEPITIDVDAENMRFSIGNDTYQYETQTREFFHIDALDYFTFE